jgi:hypothetical protein
VVAPLGVAVAVGTQILVIIIHFALKVCFLPSSDYHLLYWNMADWVERQD